MNDIQELIADLRRGWVASPTLHLAADALEALNRENEALAKRNVLLEDEVLYLGSLPKPVGEEWGYRESSGHIRYPYTSEPRPASGYVILRRMFGPWVEVSS